MTAIQVRSLPELRKKLREMLPMLMEQYHVESMAIFGSYVRGEQHPDSDLDILVTFREIPGLLKIIQLENFLSDTLKVSVDLVMKDALKPRIGKYILAEAIPV
ncbi:MAG: DNA polymerase III subunit beta [Calditrichaeota bacterium]|nr:MAG: DNA polymerase III subunit beta [Calditrichota bacterium]